MEMPPLPSNVMCMAYCSVLKFWQMQLQAIEFGDHRNLAGEATSLGRPLIELDQIALHAAFFRRPDPIHPGQVDIDMARGAGTDPAAIAVVPRHTVELGGFTSAEPLEIGTTKVL